MARRPEGWRLHQDPRTKIFFVRWRAGGRRFNRSTGSADRAAAIQRAPQLVEELSRALAVEGALVGPVAELTDRWVSSVRTEHKPSTLCLWRRYSRAHWERLFGSAADLAKPRALGAYVSARLLEVQASTVRKECSALQTLLGWCARPEVGLLAAAPKVPRPGRSAHGRTACGKMLVDLDRHQIDDLIESLPLRLRTGAPCRPLFRTLWETGLRRGTLFGLHAPGDYRLGADSLRIRKEIDKASYARSVPLTQGARDALDSVVPSKGTIFKRADHRHQLRKAAERIGIPLHLARHVSYHDFRHARITHLLDQRAPLTGVAYLVGHRRVTTTNRYAHAHEEAARRALAQT